MTGMGTARNHYTIPAFKEPLKNPGQWHRVRSGGTESFAGYLNLFASCSPRQGKGQQHSRDGEPKRDQVSVIDALEEMCAKDQPVGIKDLAKHLSQSRL